MTAATVTDRLAAIENYLFDYRVVKDFSEIEIEEIMNYNTIIRNRAKIEACIENAKRFNAIINRHGSFANYIESFGNLDEDRSLEALKHELMKFKFLGPRTAYYFMLDMGLKVWKPDRVICRILLRLNLIDSKDNIEQAVKVGKKIADEVGMPIRYVDIIFVKYGQRGEEKPFGLKNGICLEKNPRCSICGIQKYCTFLYKNSTGR